jgi:ABC-2 type transport system permease protein
MNWRALGRACIVGMRQALSEPLVLLGSVTVYWAFLLALARVLQAIPATDLQALHLGYPALVWYLIITEIVQMFSGSFNPAYLQDDIESGAIEVMLLRPTPFWQLKLADWFGQALVSFVVLGVFSMGMGAWLTGEWNWSVSILCYLIVSLLVAGLMLLCGNFMIGCATIRIGQTLPLYWLWEKLLFLLGGLYWPLLFYPGWYQRLAWFTPFPAMMAAPANTALSPSYTRLSLQLADQLFWLCLLLLACRWAAGRVRRHFQARG